MGFASRMCIYTYEVFLGILKLLMDYLGDYLRIS